MTLGEWLTKWYSLYIKPSDLAARTKEMYLYCVRAVPDALAAVDLADLTVIELQIWLIGAAAHTPRAAQQYRVMLSRSLGLARKLHLCADLVIDKETLPKPKHKAKQAAVLTGDQIRAYMTAAMASPQAPALLLCLCGLRRGEALGLRWEDVDLQQSVIHIRQQRYRVKGAYVTARLKSEHSQRSLLLPPMIVDLLRRWPRSLTGFVCDTTPEQLHKAHHQVLMAAGLPDVTLHGLRHTFATLAAGQGVSLKLLQAALGHASISLTADLYADHLQSVSSLPSSVLSMCT